MAKQQKRKSEKIGHYAEYFAVLFMLLKGYWPITLRYKYFTGEIDLILKKGQTIVFCEVKFRKNPSQLAYSVTEKQKFRIRKTAEYWLASNGSNNLDVRFDFIGLTYWRKPTHIQNAF